MYLQLFWSWCLNSLPDCGKAKEIADVLKPGEALLLENLRYYPEEEGNLLNR